MEDISQHNIWFYEFHLLLNSFDKLGDEVQYKCKSARSSYTTTLMIDYLLQNCGGNFTRAQSSLSGGKKLFFFNSKCPVVNWGIKRNRGSWGQDTLTFATDLAHTSLVTLKYLFKLMGKPINTLISPSTI